MKDKILEALKTYEGRGFIVNDELLEFIENIIEPIWIGVEIPTDNATVKICIGLNHEDGNEISYMVKNKFSETKEEWNFSGADMRIASGAGSYVFNSQHELIHMDQPFEALNGFKEQMEEHGYELVDTGGGCTAYKKEQGEHYELITVHGDPDAPTRMDETVDIGTYSIKTDEIIADMVERAVLEEYLKR